MKTFAMLAILVTAAVAAYVTGYDPEDPFLEGMEFGADADAVAEAVTAAGYDLEESSDDLIIGVRGNERLEYRFDVAGEPSFAEYSQETASATLGDALDAWRERLSATWGEPSAVSAEGSQLWIVPDAYTIRLYAEADRLVVAIDWT